MVKIMIESHTFPNSMMFRGTQLESRETVHEGSYTDIYKVAQDCLSMDEVTTMVQSRSCFIGSARQWPEYIKSTDNLKLFDDTSAAQLLSEAKDGVCLPQLFSVSSIKSIPVNISLAVSEDVSFLTFFCII